MFATTPAEVHRVYEQGVNAHDLDTVLALYDADAVMVAESGAEVTGAEAVRDAVSELVSIDGRMRIETVAVIDGGETALLRSSWKLDGTAPDGTPVHLSSHGMEVVRRGDDGHWRFVIDNPWAEAAVVA